MRRGISLIEVLISMFILAVGLLGIAALLPAGSSQINLGVRLENSNMLGRAWYRDAQIRGYLNPDEWLNVNGDKIYQPDQNRASPYTLDNGATFQPQLTFVLDPLGIHAGYGTQFPFGVGVANPLTRIMTTQTTNKAAVDTVFRSSVDLLTEKNANKDLPPHQVFFKDAGGSPVRRASGGDYSWFATITDSSANPGQEISGANIDQDAMLSVVVFHKRLLANPGEGELVCAAAFTNIGDFTLTLPATHKGVKPGQWFMVSGTKVVPVQVDPLPAPKTDFDVTDYRWYRVAAAGQPSGGLQNVTVAGRDWDPNATNNVQAFLVDGIVTVLEKHLALERD